LPHQSRPDRCAKSGYRCDGGTMFGRSVLAV
jgi:hypothetical protein